VNAYYIPRKIRSLITGLQSDSVRVIVGAVVLVVIATR
jgi:hypothetical protein